MGISQFIETDVLVIGSGGAGLTAATVAAAEGVRVCLVSKDPITGGDTKIAEGNITVVGSGSPKDTRDELVSNMRLQGDDISDPAIVEAFADDSQAAYKWLRQAGMRPQLNHKGKPKTQPIPLGGHTKARTVRHEQKGRDFSSVLRNVFMASGDHHWIEDAWALDLIMTGNSATGALVYHAAAGEFIAFSARATILACGGANTIFFPNTDTMRGNTGDAFAMALRAGASLVDMEQVQFLPFALIYPPAFQGILVGEPAIAGLSRVIRGGEGRIILDSLMVRTRAEAAAAIATTVARGNGTKNGGCYIDLTANIREKSGELFTAISRKMVGNILDNVRSALGKDAAKLSVPWEVRPTAHYNMGGIEVDEWCRVKGVDGLFAAGQSMGGLHGSNRLGSTSLGEVIVFGRRAGLTAARLSQETEIPNDGHFKKRAEEIHDKYATWMNRPGSTTAIDLITRLQQICWHGIGPARNQKDLGSMISEIGFLEAEKHRIRITSDPIWNQGFMDRVELENMLMVAAAIAQSAQCRTYSLGAHVRTDSSPGKGSTGTPGSVRIKGRTSNSLAIDWVPRSRTAFRERLRFNIRQGVKITALKFLSRLPESGRDKIQLALLEKISQKLEG